MNNLIIRSISGFIYVACIIGALISGPYIFNIFFSILLVLSLYEFYSITLPSKSLFVIFPSLLIGLLIFIVNFFIVIHQLSDKYLLVVVLLVLLLYLISFFSSLRNILVRTSILVFGLAYIVLPFILMTRLLYIAEGNTYTIDLLLGFFILLWSNDTFAYLAGISFGKHKLYEKASPKKTWEGFIGGMICTLVLALFFERFFTDISKIDWIIIALVVVIFGTLGDLFESSLKRNIKIKDSGNLIPGHGGLLDRLDSALFSIPAIFLYFYFF